MIDFDTSQPWYHGSPLELTILRAGSTITQKRELAHVFSHKPTIVSIEDDGKMKHNGILPGYLYVIAEEIQAGDVIPHPRTTMQLGDEWLTRCELPVKLLCTTSLVPGEMLSDEEIASIRKRVKV